jgi:hypothetical protein
VNLLELAFKTISPDFYFYLKRGYYKYFVSKNIKVDDYIGTAHQIEQVKTIWQIDKAINLNEFYYPPNIEFQGVKYFSPNFGFFEGNNKTVIQGSTGQGKSVYLRYLAGGEMKNGFSIPIFIELRKISPIKNLDDLIIDCLSSYGINIKKGNLEFLWKDSRTSLLLDAFDEIPQDQVEITLASIEQLAFSYGDLQILITSRKNQAIQKSTLFTVMDMSNLTVSDYRPMLAKLFNQETTIVKDIISSMQESNVDFEKVLTTPLLLTLLAITYKGYSKVPEQLHEFYENIFTLLVTRHDSTKPGFKRVFRTGLKESELEELFSGFSFFNNFSQEQELNLEVSKNSLDKAINYYQQEKVEVTLFLDDISTHTSLIHKEANKYNYVHKSIKEYYASKFIKNDTGKLKEKFYKGCIENPNVFPQELTFLSSIDSHFYNIYFLLPTYDIIFNKLKLDLKTLDFDSSIFSKIEIKYYRRSNSRIDISTAGFNYDFVGFGVHLENVINNMISSSEILYQAKPIMFGLGDRTYGFGDDIIQSSLSDIDNHDEAIKKLSKRLIPWLKYHIEKFKKIHANIKIRDEAASIISDFGDF